MVNIIHSGDNAAMLRNITEAAQKRFSMYGMEKTTMQEIAEDLGLSKGSLYYYFPDKEQLYIAVVKKEQDIFLKSLDEEMRLIKSPENLLKAYVRIRLKFFRSLLDISRFRYEELKGIRNIKSGTMSEFLEKQIEIVETIITKGVKKEIFHLHRSGAKDVAVLFLDHLKCYGDTLLRKKSVFYLEHEEYEILVKRANMFTDIFINGLKYKS